MAVLVALHGLKMMSRLVHFRSAEHHISVHSLSFFSLCLIKIVLFIDFLKQRLQGRRCWKRKRVGPIQHDFPRVPIRRFMGTSILFSFLLPTFFPSCCVTRSIASSTAIYGGIFIDFFFFLDLFCRNWNLYSPFISYRLLLQK